MKTTVNPVKDKQTVTPKGDPVARRIEGLVVRPLRTQEDKRGELVEVFNPAWGVHPDPLVYVYQASLRPGAIKGWVKHEKQDDRIYTCLGVMRWAFYDLRDGSPTYKLLNIFTVSERTRSLIIIPKGVFHAVENVGDTEAIFVNMPTRAYDHADPDKFRLPIKNDLIPFAFDDGPGW
ncbi:MAG: dTDP-4-dehydrorhamnose 3,5-epimerase family protein [Verrucomicrobiota bacterium]